MIPVAAPPGKSSRSSLSACRDGLGTSEGPPTSAPGLRAAPRRSRYPGAPFSGGSRNRRSHSASRARPRLAVRGDRKSVVEGKSVSVCVDLGGGRILKKKIHKNEKIYGY